MSIRSTGRSGAGWARAASKETAKTIKRRSMNHAAGTAAVLGPVGVASPEMPALPLMGAMSVIVQNTSGASKTNRFQRTARSNDIGEERQFVAQPLTSRRAPHSRPKHPVFALVPKTLPFRLRHWHLLFLLRFLWQLRILRAA